MAIRKKKAIPQGAPEYMVTYGDMMTLLLCFFVLLLAMSEIKQDQSFMQVVASIRQAFGQTSSLASTPGDSVPLNSLFEQLQEIIVPKREQQEGDATEEGIDGRVHKVSDIRQGVQIVIGGKSIFDRFSAVVKPEAAETIGKAAHSIAGKNTKIIVRGHATREPLPPDSIYEDAMNLSFARARAVGDVLIRNGIRPERIRLEAVGDREPINDQAYTDERRAANRRVEIIVTETLLKDYTGNPITDETELYPDG
jgi:chemotaxis protein MotB